MYALFFIQYGLVWYGIDNSITSPLRLDYIAHEGLLISVGQIIPSTKMKSKHGTISLLGITGLVESNDLVP